MALEFLKSRVTVMMKERDKAIDRADALQDTVRQATDVINKLESDKRDVEGKLNLMEDELEKLHNWKEEIMEEKSELEVEVEKLRRENDSLQNAIDTFEMAFEYKDKEIEELQNRIDQTNEELDDIVS